MCACMYATRTIYIELDEINRKYRRYKRCIPKLNKYNR